MTEVTTLDKIDSNGWDAESKFRRNTLLLLASQLSSLQANIAIEIKQMYKDRGCYNFDIKHNHERIIKLIKENTSSEFFKRMNDNQRIAYGDDGETLERMVYSWAGLEHPSGEDGEMTGINMNMAAREAYEWAEKRGKIGKYSSAMMQIAKVKEEVTELMNASNNRSIHINYTEQQEEAADVIISTLTLLHGQGIDVNKLIRDKMVYNAKRKD